MFRDSDQNRLVIARARQHRLWLPLAVLLSLASSSCASAAFVSPSTSVIESVSASVTKGAITSTGRTVGRDHRIGGNAHRLFANLEGQDPHSFQELSAAMTEAITSPRSDIDPSAQPVIHYLDQLIQFILYTRWYDMDLLTKSDDGGASLLHTLKYAAMDTLEYYQRLPFWAECTFILAPLAAVTFASLYALSFPQADYRSDKEPYPRGMYDPVIAKAYYSKHSILVVQRLMELLRLSNRFLWHLFLDKFITKKELQNRKQRAQELLQLITQLGPTAIKVGQALSVRSDIIPDEYSQALSSLQDQVPPFCSERAKEILYQELGAEKVSHLRELGLNGGRAKGMVDPIASASIGQVYKASIDNKHVAVKVQRPDVLAEIALDLHIVRELAPFYQKFAESSTDWQALANEWGRGFIAELDYRDEAASTTKFNQEMQQRNLNAVCAPTVVPDYSTERVLVTEWVDGTRLDQSNADDVPRLCSVALNAYLVMLLELQSLHCDPHPGNLLRTPDGRLCILDFGMTLDIDPNLQYSLLEFVAHLTSDNYDDLPNDMVALGFLKPDKLDFVKRSGVLENFKYFLRHTAQGGGAKGVRDRIYDEYRAKYNGYTDEQLLAAMRQEMKAHLHRESVASGITMEVEELQRKNVDSFCVPEWFLYTSRAFLTLEGVSLQADPDYSIIKNCFPYIAKRLVADGDPRARKALRDLLYGSSGESVDVDKLSELADGFSSYTTTTKTINQQAKAKSGEVILTNGERRRIAREEDRKQKLVEAEAAITLAKDSADILLAPEGNLVQSVLLEEGALAASAKFKDTVRDALVEGPKKFRKSLPLGVGNFLPPLPFEKVEPFLQKTTQEEKAQAFAEKLSTFAVSTRDKKANDRRRASFLKSVGGNTTVAISDFVQTLRGMNAEQAALVLKELRENFPKYAPLMGKMNSKFASTLLKTASSNIEATLLELEKAGRQSDPVLKLSAKGLASAAERGSNILGSSSQEEDAKEK